MRLCVLKKVICTILSVSMVWSAAAVSVVAQSSDESVEAEGKDVQSAKDELAALLGTPELMTAVPSNDQPDAQARARLFFDIGSRYYVLGDTAKAESALKYAHSLDPLLAVATVETRSKEVDFAKSFVADLSLTELRDRYARTTRIRAAGRSLIMPGWGQMYRGHKKRGLIALCVTAVTGLYLAKALGDYNSAKSAYDATRVSELDLESVSELSEIPRPFESRYDTYQSKASVANVAAIALGAVWSLAVLDNMVLEPNRFELRVEFGR
jgi:hypothetical protein